MLWDICGYEAIVRVRVPPKECVEMSLLAILRASTA